jgi:hypothetical protein
MDNLLRFTPSRGEPTLFCPYHGTLEPCAKCAADPECEAFDLDAVRHAVAELPEHVIAQLPVRELKLEPAAADISGHGEANT